MPASSVGTALSTGTYAMLFDSDLSHISLLPITGDGTQQSPFVVGSPSGIVDGVKSAFKTHIDSSTAGTEYSYSTSSFFPPNVVDFASAVTGFTQAGGGSVNISAGKYAMMPTDTGWSLVPVTYDAGKPAGEQYDFGTGSAITGFSGADFFTPSGGIFGANSGNSGNPYATPVSNASVAPDFPSNFGVHYDLVTHYTGSSGSATGITADYKTTTDIR